MSAKANGATQIPINIPSQAIPRTTALKAPSLRVRRNRRDIRLGWGLAAWPTRVSEGVLQGRRTHGRPPSSWSFSFGSRAVRASRVLLQRDEILGPGVQYRLQDAPGLFGLVAADRQGGVAVEHVQQEPPVGGQLGRVEHRGQGHRRECERRAAAAAGQLEGEGLRIEPEAQQIRLCFPAVTEGLVRHGPEAYRHLLAVAAERLAAPEPEGGSRPAPVVQLQLHLGEGLGAKLRADALLVDVGGNL